MAAYRIIWALAFFTLAVVWSSGQQLPYSSQTAGAPEKVLLAEASIVQVPSLPAESMTTPVLCFPDGTIVVRLVSAETGVQDPVSVSSDGKTVTRFGREKINDVPQPRSYNVFISDSEVYMLTNGSVQLGYEQKWKMPTGGTYSQQATKSSSFVTRFQRDGAYAGAVPLDLSFKPMQLGVFGDGDFLIVGADKDRPRVAIVGSNGQFRRFVELIGDVHAQDESEAQGKHGNDPTALPRVPTDGDPERSYMDVLYRSKIIRDGPDLLLFRPMNGPVFSISPSGEVRAHKLKVKGDYRLFTIKATQGSWIAELTHHLNDGTGDEFSTYAFDPETGATLKEYFFPRDLGFGLACVDGDEFTFVMADFEGKALKLVKLRPATLPK
jgi:hypothetical protein